MENIDERYKRGKIYTIRCRYDDTLIYVGSTIDKLAKRFAGHKADSKRKPIPLYEHINNDWKNWYIELYEDYPCDNKQQLERREGQVQREIANINKAVAGRTRKEYYNDNRDEMLEKQKQYNIDNRDKKVEYSKEYYNDNRDEMIERQRQYYKDNRDKMLEKCKCDICGAEVVKYGIKRHQKSAKCINAKK